MEALPAGTAVMLDCVLQERRRIALPYAYLTLIRWDEAGELWLDYPELIVQITGGNLGPLYAGLTTHRVFRIREAAGGISPAAVSIARISTQSKK